MAVESGAIHRREARRLYVAVAVLVASIVFAGFARTFYLKFAFDTPVLPMLSIVHGVVMSLWLILFALQAGLVAAHRTQWHRCLGITAVVMIPLMLGLGYAMAIAAARAGHQPVPGIPPTVFMAVPVVNISAFAVLAGTGIALRKRRETHRRLMLLATLVLLSPAIARLPLHVIRTAGPPLIFGLVGLVMLACIAVDVVRHRRLHPAFAFGGLFAMLAMPFALFLSRTSAWRVIALRLIG